MLNTGIYHQLPPTCFGLCYTIFRETIALLAQKLHAFCNVAIKCTIHLFFLNLQCWYSAYNHTYFVLLYLEILKMLVKILNCSTIMSVCSCYLLGY